MMTTILFHPAVVGFLQPVFVVLIGCMVLIACGLGLFVLIGEVGPLNTAQNKKRRQLPSFIEREGDIASLALGWPVRQWYILRIVVIVIGVVLGWSTGVILMIPLGFVAGVVVPRFALSGRAAKHQLNMERAFLQQLRNLRDRMALTNQSLDTALQEIGRNPGKELRYVLSPLARGGSVVQNIVECANRSRSPLLENALSVLIWSRSRSLESLIDAINEIILPIGEAQLAVSEEAMTTLTQQRAVTMAMAALMTVMFISVIRVPIFRSFYSTLEGAIVLSVVILMFTFLVWILSVIVRIESWTRWNVKEIARQQEQLHV
ncbi:MAG: type II secretion system F family protein [Candidatus Dormibacteria bacterium]